MATNRSGEGHPRMGVRVTGPILRALFDVSFTRFLTLELIGLMYVAALMMALVVTVASIFVAFSYALWAGIATVLLAPLVFVIYAIGWRISLELLIVLFRVAEYSREISENTSILGHRENPAE